MSEKLHPIAQIVVELGHLERLGRDRADLVVEINLRRMKIGRAVRELRQSRGMKLRELARQANVSKGFLSDFENGNRWSGPLLDAVRVILFTPPEGET